MGVSPEFFLDINCVGGELPPNYLHNPKNKENIFICDTFSSFDLWLTQVAREAPVRPSNLNLHFLPTRRLTCTYNDNGDFELAFPPFLPFLEALFSATYGVFEECNSRFSENPGRALIPFQSCICLCHLLDLILKMGKNEIRWKPPYWKKTNDNFWVLKVCIFTQENVSGAYFTPGRDRFAVFWQNWNSYAGRPNPNPFRAEVRLEREGQREGFRRLVLDVSVRQWTKEQRIREAGKNVYNPPSEVDLIDLIFGPKRHHLLIAEGDPEECFRLIKETMRFLGVSHLIRSTNEIPPKRAR